MKKLIILLFLFLFNSNVFAQAGYIPNGCYVAYDNPGVCWGNQTFPYKWLFFGESYAQTAAIYGGPVAYLIADWHLRGKSIASCENANSDLVARFNNLLNVKDSCVNDYSTLASSCNSSEVNRQQWIAYGNAQARLVKKLRKACGAKCKKIK